MLGSEQSIPMPLDTSLWRGRRVFLTGHTGFIGGWTASVLHELGAFVHGYALAPPTKPSFFDLCGLGSRIEATTGDVRQRTRVAQACAAARPEVVIHLAAQPLVAVGYSNPVETFETNVMGTVHLIECVRTCGAAAVVVMTSDKVYRDPQSRNTEEDRLGGTDPYSGSKVCAETVAEVYATSFLERRRIPVATVRAGNVVGGGDWAAYRLVPDAVRAFGSGVPLKIRRPGAVRPWQHVLDAVHGLLLVAQHTLKKGQRYAAWNIGPASARRLTVGEVADLAASAWGASASVVRGSDAAFAETEVLTIDSRRARATLGYEQPWSLPQVVGRTIEWYRQALRGDDAWKLSLRQINAYFGACASFKAHTNIGRSDDEQRKLR